MSDNVLDPIICLYPDGNQTYSTAAWADAVLQPVHLAVACASKVLEIRHYKSRLNKLHEHLRIRVEVRRDPDTEPRLGWVLIERQPSSSFSNSRISSSVSLNSRSPSSFSDAEDRVIIPKAGHEKDIVKDLRDNVDIVCELSIHPNTSFSIADLAVLLPLVTDLERKYNPFTTQCYWYASTIYRVVQGACEGYTERQGTAYGKRGKIGGIDLPRSPMPEAAIIDLRTRWTEGKKDILAMRTIQEVGTHILSCHT